MLRNIMNLKKIVATFAGIIVGGYLVVMPAHAGNEECKTCWGDVQGAHSTLSDIGSDCRQIANNRYEYIQACLGKYSWQTCKDDPVYLDIKAEFLLCKVAYAEQRKYVRFLKKFCVSVICKGGSN